MKFIFGRNARLSLPGFGIIFNYKLSIWNKASTMLALFMPLAMMQKYH